MLVKDLIEIHPRLFHMAEAGSWDSIRNLGLLSTTAALDILGIEGKSREKLECQHRSEKVSISADGTTIVLRDQKPMPPSRLLTALHDGSTPESWYQLINSKVFFWADESR